MDTRFPKMLFRFPGAGPDAAMLQDGPYSMLVVQDEAAHDAALAEGWSETPTAARAAHEAPQPAEDNAPPTRAELEAKATELGIKFDGRTGDKKLRDQIAAALED